MKPLVLVGNQYVVTAISDYDPLTKLVDIEKELKKYKFKGLVLFDLLYTNGLCNNRFVEINFDGNKFNRKSYHIKSSISCILKKHQDNFFYQNPNFLTSSILTSNEVEKFISNKNLTKAC